MRVQPSFSKFILAAIFIAALWLPVSAQQQPAPAAAAPPAAEAKPEKTGPQPKALVPEPIVDLGEITYGETRTLAFAIKNTGTDVLRIHAAKSSCACAVTEFTKEIAPGAEGKIDVNFDAALSAGPSAVPIDVVSNDPSSPTLRLTIKATIRYFIQAQPGYVRYLVVQNFEADSTVKQNLWALDNAPMKITKVEAPYDFIEATFREAKPEEVLADANTKQQWVIETRISPKAPVGALAGFLTIHTDHPKQSLVKLPVNGFVRPMFAVTPAEADFGGIKVDEKGSRASLLIKNFAEENVKMTGAESTVAGITPSIEEIEDKVGREYWLILNYAPDMAKGKFSGVIRIKTESPKQPLIEVPVRGTIL